jgi:hypothetical protein
MCWKQISSHFTIKSHKESLSPFRRFFCAVPFSRGEEEDKEEEEEEERIIFVARFIIVFANYNFSSSLSFFLSFFLRARTCEDSFFFLEREIETFFAPKNLDPETNDDDSGSR